MVGGDGGTVTLQVTASAMNCSNNCSGIGYCTTYGYCYCPSVNLFIYIF